MVVGAVIGGSWSQRRAGRGPGVRRRLLWLTVAAAGLVCVALALTAVASADVEFFPVPEEPQGMAAGPGGMWFFAGGEDPYRPHLYYMGLTGTVAPYELDDAVKPALTVGPEGAVWWVSDNPVYGPAILRHNGAGWADVNIARSFEHVALSSSGAIWTDFRTPTLSGATETVARVIITKEETDGELQSELIEYPSSHLQTVPGELGQDMVVASDGSVWFRSHLTELARFAAGTYSYFPIPNATSSPDPQQPYDLLAGPDGEVWFVDAPVPAGGAISSITAAGVVHFFKPAPGVVPVRLTLGSDGDLWFTYFDPNPQYEGDGVAKMTPQGAFTYYPPSLLGGEYRTSGGLAGEPGGPVWVGVTSGSTQSAPRYGILRITPDTPGLASPEVSVPGAPAPTGPAAPPAATVLEVKPIVVPARVRRAVSRLKSSAQAIEPYLTATDVADLALRLTLAAAAPELAPEILLPGSTMEAAMELVDGGIGVSVATIAGDPPDPNYKAIPAVHPSRAPVLQAKQVSRSAARAWNSMITNGLSSSAYLDALVASNERLDGAALAANCVWMRRQQQAARRYAAAAARDLARAPGLIGVVEHDMKTHALPNVMVGTAQVKQAKAQVAKSGLPSSVLATLRQAGATRADVSQLAAAFVAASPSATSLTGVLTSRAHATAAVLRRIRQLAAALTPAPACFRARHRRAPRGNRDAKSQRANKL